MDALLDGKYRLESKTTSWVVLREVQTSEMHIFSTTLHWCQLDYLTTLTEDRAT